VVAAAGLAIWSAAALSSHVGSIPEAGDSWCSVEMGWDPIALSIRARHGCSSLATTGVFETNRICRVECGEVLQ
jgi:hypothetical protein